MGNPDSKVFTLRLSTAEWHALEARAKSRKVSVATLLREGVGLPPKPMGRPKVAKKTPKRSTPSRAARAAHRPAPRGRNAK